MKIYSFKVNLNDSEIIVLNNYFKCVRFIYSYIYSYKIKMYYNYIINKLKYNNIFKVIDSLDKMYSVPDIEILKEKCNSLKILDNNIIYNRINYVNKLFNNYFMNIGKFPSFEYINYFNSYSIDKEYFIKYFLDIYSKYLINIDLNKCSIFLKNNNDNFFYLLVKEYN